MVIPQKFICQNSHVNTTKKTFFHFTKSKNWTKKIKEIFVNLALIRKNFFHETYQTSSIREN